MPPPNSGVRLSELLGAMSFGIDLAMGNQPEHVLRQTVISLRLAERLGLDDDAQEVVFYTSMLASSTPSSARRPARSWRRGPGCRSATYGNGWPRW
jgi:hypothetical protein